MSASLWRTRSACCMGQDADVVVLSEHAATSVDLAELNMQRGMSAWMRSITDSAGESCPARAGPGIGGCWVPRARPRARPCRHPLRNFGSLKTFSTGPYHGAPGVLLVLFSVDDRGDLRVDYGYTIRKGQVRIGYVRTDETEPACNNYFPYQLYHRLSRVISHRRCRIPWRVVCRQPE